MKKKIFTVATVHLDTTWSWTLETTVSDYLKKTIYENLQLLKKYPDYRLSFEGAYRYELMEEYYPEQFKELRRYIAAGRWCVSGSAYENGDTNIPSPEALFRNILYGNGYFEQKFNKRSCDLYLPDCFGFGAALPSVAFHAGLSGFTTQKLAWSCSKGIPFDLGVWKGINGNGVYACLDGRDYNYNLTRVRSYKPVERKLVSNSVHYSLPMTDILYGIGDRGGSPREESVAAVCAEIARNPQYDTDVVAAATDTVFREMKKLSDEVKAGLPVYEGELISTDHGVGCYTSRTASKRFNRRFETLAAAAENLCVTAKHLGVYEYPAEKFTRAWKRVTAHQFHDDITGTSLPECYKRTWNDYIMSLNEISEEYRAAAAALSTVIDMSFVNGTAVLVHNPLQYERKASVQMIIPASEHYFQAAVFDCFGNELPSQFTRLRSGALKVVFSVCVKGYSVTAFDIRDMRASTDTSAALQIGNRFLENSKYRVQLDENGDIFSLFDKTLGAELLHSPIRTGIIKYNGSATWPAWEMDYRDNRKKPSLYASAPEFFVEENGAARVTMKTVRTAGDSQFIQHISLDRDSEFVSVFNEVEWRSPCSLQKTVFSFNASNSEARYDLGLGYISRENMNKKLYEVPAQNFADITDKSGEFGVSVFSDSRVGWDKYDNRTLRLTGMHTPRAAWRAKQNMLDMGLNRFGYAVYSHGGSSLEGSVKQSCCFLSPLTAFGVKKNISGLNSFSLIKLNTEAAVIRCVKKAEYSDEIIVRVGEADNKTLTNVCLTFAGGIEKATELNASEEYIREMPLSVGRLVFGLKPFEVRTFALKVRSRNLLPAFKSKLLPLPYNTAFASSNKEKTDSTLPDGTLVPTELLPENVKCGGVSFLFTDKAVRCSAQTLKVPSGATALSFAVAAFSGDTEAVFLAGNRYIRKVIQSATERIGAWDLYSEGETGYIKRRPLVWSFTHSHDANGEDLVCREMYFFRCDISLDGETEITLPDNENIVIASACAVFDAPAAVAGAPLYDELAKRPVTYRMKKADMEKAKNSFFRHSRSRRKFLLHFARARLSREIRQLNGKSI